MDFDTALSAIKKEIHLSNWNVVIELCRSYRNEFPAKIDLYTNEILSLSKLHQYNYAFELASKAINLFPNSELLYLMISNLFDEFKCPSTAISYYKTAQVKFPNNIRFFSKCVDEYNLIGDYNKQFELIQLIIQKFPNAVDGHAHLAKFYTSRQEWRKALTSWMDVLQVNDTILYVYEYISAAYRNLCEYESALTWAQIVTDKFPNVNKGIILKIETLKAIEDWSSIAEECLKYRMEKTNPDGKINLYEIQAYINLNKYSEAKQLSEESIVSFEDSLELRLQYIDILLNEKNYQTAISALNILCKKFPNEKHLAIKLARLYITTGNKDDAVQALDCHINSHSLSSCDPDLSLSDMIYHYGYNFVEKVHKYNTSFSKEYYNSVRTFPQWDIKNFMLTIHDNKEISHIVSDGCRYTHDSPEAWKNSVYLLGPCTMYGAYNGDEQTVASYLQRICNHNNQALRVVNMAMPNCPLQNIWMLLNHAIDVKSGDYVAILCEQYKSDIPYWIYIKKMQEFCEHKGAKFITIMNGNLKSSFTACKEEQLMTHYPTHSSHIKNWKMAHQNYMNKLTSIGCNVINFQDDMERPHSFGFPTYTDGTHVTPIFAFHVASSLYSNFICNDDVHYSNEDLTTDSIQHLVLFIRKLLSNDKSFREWIKAIPQPTLPKDFTIGAIVMNCNPFTNGHLYLIEHALKVVDFLYVFVVEEDRSIFPFADRIGILQQHFKNSNNICVIPSGKFIISSSTFDEYFRKDTNDNTVDSSKDVLFFASLIAPYLNITHRFVGEEPYCKTTSQYNNDMAYLFSKVGINFHVIPRKEHNDTAISATKVRLLIEKKEVEQLKELIPDTTLNYLFAKNYL